MPSFNIRTTPKAAILKAVDKMRFSYADLNIQRNSDGVITVTPVLKDGALPPSTPQGLQQFDQSLTQAVAQTNKEFPMSVTGADLLGSSFRDALAKVKAKVAAAQTKMNSSMDDLNSSADLATKMAQQVDAEAANLKAALGMVTNNPPDK